MSSIRTHIEAEEARRRDKQHAHYLRAIACFDVWDMPPDMRAEVAAEWPAVRHSYVASGLLPLARLIRSNIRLDHESF